MHHLAILLVRETDRDIGVHLSYKHSLTRKMVPITGRASSLLEIFCMYDKRFQISKTK